MSARGAAVATAAGAIAFGLLAAGVAVGTAQAQQGAGGGNGPGPRATVSTQTQARSTTGPMSMTGTGQRHGYGRGSGPDATTPWTGSSTGVALTAQQRADLLAMVEEEKLAGDVYQVLGERFDDPTLTRIAASEDRHAAAVRRLLERHGIEDPTQGLGVGEFATTGFQRLYDRLVAQGAESLTAAYAVGAQIERLDIADLGDAIAAAQGRTDIVRVYTHLRTGSSHHLAAFTA